MIIGLAILAVPLQLATLAAALVQPASSWVSVGARAVCDGGLARAPRPKRMGEPHNVCRSAFAFAGVPITVVNTSTSASAPITVLRTAAYAVMVACGDPGCTDPAAIEASVSLCGIP